MKVLIAVPTFENIYPDVFKSIYDLQKPKGVETEFEYIRGYDCATARNRIVITAQNMKADYVLMIDNDTILPSDALINLFEDQQDVVLGYYAHRNNENEYGGLTNWCKLGEFNYTWQYSGKECKALLDNGHTLVHLHGGGMGCAFIKTDVFDRISYPWYDWVNYSDEHRGMLSEDLYFCEQCKHKHIKIYGDTRVKCGHIFRHIQEAD
nr:hypothetical protein [Clostridia bacterium]